MRLQRLTTPATLALAITMAATTAFAQSGNESRRRSRDNSNRATASAQQSNEERSNGSRGEVAVRRSAPRSDSTRVTESSRRGASDNRGNGAGASGNPGNDNRGYSNRGNASRSNDSRGYSNGGNSNRGYDNGRYDNRGYGYGHYYGNYNRSQWYGRVHFGLGISIFSGRPFAFHFGYGWRPGFAYHYPMTSGMAYGGMSFLLNPDHAEVYVDGNYVGVARDFGGQPVPVAVGYHRIELYAPGFAPAAFDVTVRPGQVIPYRGSLYPAY